MYKNSIKENSKYITPFLEGIKYYGSDEIEHGIGTMIILNENGDILTCKHIAKELMYNQQCIDNYPNLIKKLLGAKNKDEKRKIEKEYNLKKDSVVLNNIKFLINVVDKDGICSFEIIFHEYLDIAIIRSKNIKLSLDNYPVFSRNMPEQGQSICRIGYAFPEYDIFEYSNEENKIILKKNAILNFPIFPLDGIVTRHIKDEKGNVSGFETSTPGLRGQSGGPIFDPDGIIYGIQCMTKHLDLNFDIMTKVKRGIELKKVESTPFINLGIGISSVEIIKFLEENNICFNSK